MELAEVWEYRPAVWAQSMEVDHISDLARHVEEAVDEPILCRDAGIGRTLLLHHFEAWHKSSGHSITTKFFGFLSGGGMLSRLPEGVALVRRCLSISNHLWCNVLVVCDTRYWSPGCQQPLVIVFFGVCSVFDDRNMEECFSFFGRLRVVYFGTSSEPGRCGFVLVPFSDSLIRRGDKLDPQTRQFGGADLYAVVVIVEDGT